MIRGFQPDDADLLAELCRASIRELGSRRYSPEQVAAWHNRAPDSSDYLARVARGHRIFVSEADSEIAAYALLEPDGHLDRLFCHPRHAGKGHASALLAHAEKEALHSGLTRLHTEASEVARAVFERAGYLVDHRRDFDMNGVAIHNYAMSKVLDPQVR